MNDVEIVAIFIAGASGVAFVGYQVHKMFKRRTGK